MHQVGRDVEHKGCVELAAVHWAFGLRQLAREVQGEDVHGEDARLARAQCRERLLVRVVPVGGEDDERINASLFPGPEEIVHPAM